MASWKLDPLWAYRMTPPYTMPTQEEIDRDRLDTLDKRITSTAESYARIAKAIPTLKRKIEEVSAALTYMGRTLFPRVTSAPDAAIKVTAYEARDDRQLVHRGGYRTAPLARVSPAPRRGFRAIAYLGNDLALRARPTSLRRIAWAWIAGTMIRLWWCSVAVWPMWDKGREFHATHRRRLKSAKSSGCDCPWCFVTL